MSTKANILDARGKVTAHVAEHKCSPRLLAMARGETPCDVRLELHLAYMAVTARWATEPTDTASFQLDNPQAAVL